tara:strand:+ start:160 stop:747 length:588 start_codon:yes stop_codon:yes gene_type:complete
MTYAIAAGCSHTAGVGNDLADCYVSLLEKHYGFPINNHGVPGGGCTDVLLKIIAAVKATARPKFIVAQWPNPFRKHIWHGDQLHLQNINNSDDSFRLLVKNSERNFYEPWIQAIVTANLMCQLSQIPIINIMLENVEPQYYKRLQQENIQLHVDEKLPLRTWLFDNAASDKLHHSPQCHSQWADRLIGIINEYTT